MKSRNLKCSYVYASLTDFRFPPNASRILAAGMRKLIERKECEHTRLIGIAYDRYTTMCRSDVPHELVLHRIRILAG